MRAEIIVVGSELTDGAKLDTNGQWLSNELVAAGLTVTRHTTLADDLTAMADTFRGAAARADLLIVTGGLGPTLDDLTRQAVALAMDVPLVRDDAALARLKAIFAARGRAMPDRNRIQADFPQGAETIPNLRGTAPGFWCELPRAAGGHCRLAALPGVPSEMKPMFRESVLPRLRGTGRVIRRLALHCFGEGESAIEERLGDLTARGREPEIGITAHEGTITLRITATGSTPEDCETRLAADRKRLHDLLGDLLFGEQDTTLQQVLVETLARRNETVSVLETRLTGGRVTDLLTSVRGADRVMHHGVTLGNLDAITPLLNVPSLAGTDAATLARQWAEGFHSQFGTTWCLTTVCWPLTDADSDPTPPVEPRPGGAVAVVGPDVVLTAEYRSYGDRAIDRSRAAMTALNLLRRALARG